MRKAKKGYVYILSNTTRTIFYIGVTSDLIERVCRHRHGQGSAFATRYNLTSLVYFEQYPSMLEAIAREKQLKNWKRSWKLELIRTINPRLRDLWADLRGYE